MKNKFYILYGYKIDEYEKLTEYTEIGKYNSLNDVNRAKEENNNKFKKFVFKEDYYFDAPDYVFMPFELITTDSLTLINDNYKSKDVDVSVYKPIKSVCSTENLKTNPIIICIVGASGSGKTALSLHLEEEYNIPAICSYTTRPMREGEKDGREHYFVNEFAVENPDDILAYTLYGGYHYWTTHSQVKHKILCTYVIDKRGLDEFKNKWSDRYKIISVLITRSNRDSIDNERKLRDLDNPTDGEYDIEIINDFDNLNDFFYHAVGQISIIVKKIRGLI